MNKTKVSIQECACSITECAELIKEKLAGAGCFIFEGTEEVIFKECGALDTLSGFDWESCFRLRAFNESAEVLLEKEPFSSDFNGRIIVEGEGRELPCRDTSYLLGRRFVRELSRDGKSNNTLVYREFFSPDADGVLMLEGSRIVGLGFNGGNDGN